MTTATLIDGAPTGIRGLNKGGVLGWFRLASNITQQGMIHFGTLFACWYGWNNGVSWIDLSILVILFFVTGMGVSVGFHRMVAHRAFDASFGVRFLFAVAGCMSMAGSAGRWATEHIRHHAYADQPGDIHSPLMDPMGKTIGFWRGLWHSHIGWMFNTIHTDPQVFGRVVWSDPAIKWASRFHWVWIALGLLIPWNWGYWLGGTSEAAFSAMLWGGFVRAFWVLHAALAITSLCHIVGDKRYPAKNESRNSLIIALTSLGEGWHSNHHRFPRSARHGILPGEYDLGGWLIDRMEQIGLVSNVVRIPERLIQQAIAGDNETMSQQLGVQL